MAKTNILNTRTTNYLELVGNGKLYRVPPYQRDYSWEEEQWEDLWNDVIELQSNPEASHYMGALVVEGKSDREFHIIDGQQRMATLSILALAIISRLRQLASDGIEPVDNEERAWGLRSRFIGEKNPASLVESSKLSLNDTDDPFYQEYLVQLREPKNPRGLRYSNKQLWHCFKYFLDKVKQLPLVEPKGEKLAELLAETIGRQLMFILITVDDEINAYTVFETLNARGLELSSTDLLKNYLFSRVGTPDDLDSLQRRWKALMSTISQERFPEFLRYHLLCEFQQVRTQRLFKMVRDRVKNPQEVFGLMDELEGRAELFAALSDPYHAFWQESKENQKFIQELVLFRVGQMTPLLFAAFEKFSSTNFTSILRLVSVIAFRYTVVSGQNTNALEPEYHKAARAILDGKANAPIQIFNLLKPALYVEDEVFRENFVRLVIRTNGQRKKLAKYILAKLESHISGRYVDSESDPGTIEHILPENPVHEWDTFIPRDRWEETIYRLGNLTLLELSKNRAIGNEIYAEKQKVYVTSNYDTTRKIAEDAPEEWTLEHINKRQAYFASIATHLWRFS